MNIQECDSFKKYIEMNGSTLNFADEKFKLSFFKDLSKYIESISSLPPQNPKKREEMQFIKSYLNTFLSKEVSEIIQNKNLNKLQTYVHSIFSKYDHSQYKLELIGEDLSSYGLFNIQDDSLVKRKLVTSLFDIFKNILNYSENMNPKDKQDFFITYVILLQSDLDEIIRKAYTMSDDQFSKY